MMGNAPKLSIGDIAQIFGMTRQAIHAKLRTQKIESHKIGRSRYLTHNQTRLLFSTDYKKQKIAIHHIKGGVGKTTASDNIGDAANALGARVLKIDADFQKNLTLRHNISDKKIDNTPVLIDLITGNGLIEESIINISDGLDLIPSRFENVNIDNALSNNNTINLQNIFQELLAPIEKNYDLILIDCPAMLGKLVTAIAAYSDFVLCPLNPESFSIQGLEIFKKEIKSINAAYNINVQYKAFLNKFEASTILSEGTVNESLTKEIKNGSAFDIVVKKSQEIPNAQDKKKTLFSTIKKSDVRDDFLLLTIKTIGFDLSNNSLQKR